MFAVNRGADEEEIAEQRERGQGTGDVLMLSDVDRVVRRHALGDPKRRWLMRPRGGARGRTRWVCGGRVPLEKDGNPHHRGVC